MKSTRKWFCLVLLLLIASAVLAQFPQQPTQTIRARITGGGGSGKCTFEVVIDGSADVEIRGMEGRLRWVSGGPVSWRRLECNQPLPRNPRNFRFEGVDGRGTQSLTRDPNSNVGLAVIHLDDPQRGTEGYTGDLLWDGSNDDDYRGGPDRGNYNGPGNWDRGEGYWNDRGNPWNPSSVSRCQDAIRGKLVSRFGGSISFQGQATPETRGPFVFLTGRAFYRDGNARSGDIEYSCAMAIEGDVLGARFRMLGGGRPTRSPR